MHIVVGSITLDLFIAGIAALPTAGDDGFRANNLVFCDQPLAPILGGNGACCAYALAGLGASTALCGAVGQDELGRVMSDWLAARNIELSSLTRSAEHGTSTSTVLMTESDQQVVFHHVGANAITSLDALPDRSLRNASTLLLASYPLLTAMRPDGFAAALRTVRANGGITALDIGPAIGQPARLDELKPMLPDVAYLLANEHELRVCTDSADWEESCIELLQFGANYIIVKRGAGGAAVRSAYAPIDVPGFDVAARFTAGAGDAFNAGFLHAIQNEQPLRAAVRFANAVAALVVSGPRGILSAPKLAEVEAFLAERQLDKTV